MVGTRRDGEAGFWCGGREVSRAGARKGLGRDEGRHGGAAGRVGVCEGDAGKVMRRGGVVRRRRDGSSGGGDEGGGECKVRTSRGPTPPHTPARALPAEENRQRAKDRRACYLISCDSAGGVSNRRRVETGGSGLVPCHTVYPWIRTVTAVSPLSVGRPSPSPSSDALTRCRDALQLDESRAERWQREETLGETRFDCAGWAGACARADGRREREGQCDCSGYSWERRRRRRQRRDSGEIEWARLILPLHSRPPLTLRLPSCRLCDSSSPPYLCPTCDPPRPTAALDPAARR